MIDLVKEERMTSLQVAEITGKEHKNVLRDIRNMEASWVKVNGRRFELVDYIDAKGEKRPCYSLTKTECLYIATKFNDEARAKLVLRWEELEKAKSFVTLPDFSNPAEAARAWADQYEKTKAAEKEMIALSKTMAVMEPKVSYYDKILNSKATVTVTQIAQDYGLSAKALNDILQRLGIQHKVNGQWILYAPHISQGYVHSKSISITHADGTQGTKLNTEWTQKGRLFLYNELKNIGYLPLIEQ